MRSQPRKGRGGEGVVMALAPQIGGERATPPPNMGERDMGVFSVRLTPP